MNPLQPDFNPRRQTVAVYGKYVVQHDPLVHPPYGLYRISRGDKRVGATISFPSASDCEWLDRWDGNYATQSAKLKRPTNRHGATPTFNNRNAKALKQAA